MRTGAHGESSLPQLPGSAVGRLRLFAAARWHRAQVSRSITFPRQKLAASIHQLESD